MEEETVSLTQEELNDIRQIQSLYQELTLQLGQAKLQLLGAQRREEKLEAQFVDLQARENKMFEKLNTKYGPGSFNLQSGEFTPVQSKTTQTEVK